MNTERRLARVRAGIDRWFGPVVIVLLVLALFGGWTVLAANADTTADTDQRTVDTWSTTGGFDHYATVQSENEVFEVGEELPRQEVYFTQIAPEVDGEFTHQYNAQNGDVTVDLDLEREIRAVDDDTEYWSTSEPLNESTATGVEPGDRVGSSFAIDVPALEEEIERTESSLGDSPGTTEAVVVAEVTMEGTIEGEPVQHTDRYELLIEPDGDTYSVEGPVAERYTQERVEEVDPTAESGSTPMFGMALLLGSIAAIGVLSKRKVNGTLAPSEAELERLRVTGEREEFDEWVSAGTLPDEVRERSRVTVASLEDLVDVAIDCDRRVIEDETEEGGTAYYVVDGDLLYVYEFEEVPDPNADEFGETFVDGERNGADDEIEFDSGSDSDAKADAEIESEPERNDSSESDDD
ncbi:DUF5305 domain-containing protein [Natrialba swarupiae]|uniref:DUF5305 domain-containing protein n=1 Tax=Natrialba swarupiae TaxID=2448032 RepID=UPI001390D740|nr:DUF5305 domain-containing protein [Natrialba swarupiae]